MSPPGRRLTIVALAIAAAIVIGAVGGVIAARDGGEPSADGRRGAGSDTARQEARAPASQGSGRETPDGAALRPLVPGRPGAGSARIAGRGRRTRLELGVSGLPALEEEYAVWLYNSVTDARRLGAAQAGRFKLSSTLPAGAARYTWIDISREPLDGNSNHSGESVLRVRLADVPRASR